MRARLHAYIAHVKIYFRCYGPPLTSPPKKERKCPFVKIRCTEICSDPCMVGNCRAVSHPSELIRQWSPFTGGMLGESVGRVRANALPPFHGPSGTSASNNEVCCLSARRRRVCALSRLGATSLTLRRFPQRWITTAPNLVRDSASVANFHILVVVVCLLEFENLVPDSIHMLSLRFLVLTRLYQARVEASSSSRI